MRFILFFQCLVPPNGDDDDDEHAAPESHLNETILIR